MTKRPNQSSPVFLAASLVTVIAASAFAAHSATAQAKVVTVPAYTVCDFIDERIDVDAQYALTILVKRGGSSRTTGLAIFTAIKTGRLAGIYQQNRGEPALLAQRLPRRIAHLPHGLFKDEQRRLPALPGLFLDVLQGLLRLLQRLLDGLRRHGRLLRLLPALLGLRRRGQRQHQARRSDGK